VKRVLVLVLVIVVLVVIILVGLFLIFRPNVGQYAVVRAVNNDFIIEVEDRRNGTVMLWAENVNDQGYCIRSQPRWVEVAYLLSSMHLRPEIGYQTINKAELDGMLWGGCDPEDPTITVYRVTSFDISLEAQDNLTPRQRERLQPYDDVLTLPSAS
jgi:hypothetical protein